MVLVTEKAIFAAGCFWSVQDEFDNIPGVIKTLAGYTGGRTNNPTWEKVASKTTGHLEAVEVIFNPKKVSYEQLLAVFWKVHDPTQANGQWPNIGPEYRSAIFYTNSKQKKLAEKSLRKEQKKTDKKIATEIVKASEFYEAEEYHQHYNKKQGRSCKI